MKEWRTGNTTQKLLHEFKLRLRAASGGIALSAQPQELKIDAVCFLQGGLLQARIAIELLFFALLSSRRPGEVAKLGQQWSNDHKPSSIHKKLQKAGISYWPERVAIGPGGPRIHTAAKLTDTITASEVIGFYGKLNDLLHAKRQVAVGETTLDETEWISSRIKDIQVQTECFIVYSEGRATHLASMHWENENAPLLFPLKLKATEA